jgi:hypothetical protein
VCKKAADNVVLCFFVFLPLLINQFNLTCLTGLIELALVCVFFFLEELPNATMTKLVCQLTSFVQNQLDSREKTMGKAGLL